MRFFVSKRSAITAALLVCLLQATAFADPFTSWRHFGDGDDGSTWYFFPDSVKPIINPPFGRNVTGKPLGVYAWAGWRNVDRSYALGRYLIYCPGGTYDIDGAVTGNSNGQEHVIDGSSGPYRPGTFVYSLAQLTCPGGGSRRSVDNDLPASTDKAPMEHCLVVQAVALAGYNARMQLLVGTDDIFSSAYYAEQAASTKVSEKYNALFAARNSKGSEDNPENRLASFKSPAERAAYFRKWQTDITALEAAQNKEISAYSDAFKRAMDADHNPATQRRLARINAQWNTEFHTPCYWGEPK